MNHFPFHPQSILRLRDVKVITGLSSSTIYNKLNPKSPWYDEFFPKSIKLGNGKARNCAVGWLAGDVLTWIQACRNGR